MVDHDGADNKRIDAPTGTETVGHEWDGIEELNTPLPRWWLWTFYITIVWAIGYTVVYPAWPMVSNFTKGSFGWTSRGQYDEQMKLEAAKRAPITDAIEKIPMADLPRNPQLMAAAIEGGRAAFKVYCVQCHGSGAAGSKGFPNLNDDDWLWGGDLQTVHATLVNGIRQPGNNDTRNSMMPAFGRDGILKPAEIQSLVAHVQAISHRGKDNAKGAALFAVNCAVCHGPEGKGNRQFGAPNLTDGIWLYGGDAETLTETITNARAGVMPAWGQSLKPATVKMLAAYVHSLGGGEATPAPALVAEAAPASAEAGNNVQP